MATLADSFLQVPRHFQGMDSGSSHTGTYACRVYFIGLVTVPNGMASRLRRGLFSYLWCPQDLEDLEEPDPEADELGAWTGSIMMSETANDSHGRAT